MHSLPLLCVRVQHPNLVGWHEVVIAPSQAEVSIIMELAAGGNGRRALMARGALPEDDDWPGQSPLLLARRKFCQQVLSAGQRTPGRMRRAHRQRFAPCFA